MTRKLAIGCLTPVLVALIAAGVFAYRQHRYVERVYARAQAMGVPTTYAELEAMYPMPPEGENAAFLYQEAFALNDAVTASLSDESRIAYESLPIVGFAEPPDGIWLNWTEDMKAIASRYLLDYENVLAKTHEAAAMAECGFPNIFADDSEVNLDHLIRIRAMGRIVALEARSATWNGRPEDAIRAIEALTNMAEHLQREPILNSQLVATVLWRYAIETSHETVLSRGFDAAQLAAIAEIVLQPDDPEALSRGYCGEIMMFQVDLLTSAPLSSYKEEYPRLYRLLSAASRPIEGILETEIRGFMLRQFEILRTPALNTHAEALTLMAEIDKDPLIKPLYPGLLHLYDAYMRPLAQARSVAALCAIERYRLDHGSVPAALEDLVPAYLDAVPLDPFDGNPLRYNPQPDGSSLLYSIGPNRIDDGGAIAVRSLDGDVVVRVQP